MAGLTDLEDLGLSGNAIENLSPLVANTGLGSGDKIDVGGNPLNAVSIDTHIPALRSRGVEVSAENLITAPQVPSQVVDIPDPNLRVAIESTLGIVPGGTITARQMATLTHLGLEVGLLNNSNISNVTGLEYATNLTYLDLWENTISDISPVAGLTNLTTLNLSDNNISDISALAGLTNLTELALRGNAIVDLSPLVANTELGEGG